MYSETDLATARRFFDWMQENGEREILLRKLRLRLYNCGWIEEMKTRCKQVYQRSTHGIEDVTVEELVWDLRHVGKSQNHIPDAVRIEILEHIQFLWVRFRQEDPE